MASDDDVNSLELFLFSVFSAFILFCLSSLFYGLLPDTNKWRMVLLSVHMHNPIVQIVAIYCASAPGSLS